MDGAHNECSVPQESESDDDAVNGGVNDDAWQRPQRSLFEHEGSGNLYEYGMHGSDGVTVVDHVLAQVTRRYAIAPTMHPCDTGRQRCGVAGVPRGGGGGGADARAVGAERHGVRAAFLIA